MSQALIVVLDSWGTCYLDDGTVHPTLNTSTRFATNGVAINTLYEVSSCKFKGAKRLTTKQRWSVFPSYYPDKGPIDEDGPLTFCSQALQKVFGEVPKEIYYKEV